VTNVELLRAIVENAEIETNSALTLIRNKKEDDNSVKRDVMSSVKRGHALFIKLSESLLSPPGAGMETRVSNLEIDTSHTQLIPAAVF